MFLLLLGLLAVFCPSAWASHAASIRIDDVRAVTDAPNPTRIEWELFVVYQGSDVPNGFAKETISVTVSTSTTPAGLAAAALAAIQNYGSANGFPVGTGNTLLPSFSSQ